MRARRPLPPVLDGSSVVPAAAQARAHLLGLYLLLGLTVSSWLARLPTVRAALDLDAAEVGTVMLLGAVGSLASGLAAGPVIARFGPVRTLTAGSLLFSVAYALLGAGPTLGSLGWFIAGVVGMSMSFALMSVPMNVETVALERRIGRTIVPQFHAAFSVGSVVGSGLGALAAWAQVSVGVQFGVVALATLGWRLYAVPRSLLPVEVAPDSPPVRRGGLRAGLGAWRERRTLVIGVVVAAGALSEGSANTWVTIAVVDGFAASEATAALVFGIFVAAMTAARLAGTWAIDRFGRYRVVAGSGVLAIAGVVAFATLPSLLGAGLGVLAWGLGAGLVVPIGMAAVSTDPLRAPARVSVLTSMTSLVSIAAPFAIGLAADAIGTRLALLLVAAGMVVGVVASGAVRQTEPLREPVRSAPVPAGLPGRAATDVQPPALMTAEAR